MFLFSAVCILAGTVHHISAVIIGRFFSGFLSAIPLMVVAGPVEDVYGPEARVWMIFAWGVAANMGLTFGSIYSTYATENLGWYVLIYLVRSIMLTTI
jgi:MFS family permease